MAAKKPKWVPIEGITDAERARGWEALRTHPDVWPAWRVAAEQHKRAEGLAPDAALGAARRRQQRENQRKSVEAKKARGENGGTLKELLAGFRGSPDSTPLEKFWEFRDVLREWSESPVEDGPERHGEPTFTYTKPNKTKTRGELTFSYFSNNRWKPPRGG
jgi:hypothetical protein